MTVGFRLGSITDEVGAPDFLHAFFSTVSVNLEPEGWASRFPLLLGRFHSGALEPQYASDALKELAAIQVELRRLPIEALVWDVDDSTKSPPWGDNISADITDLSNYFVTSTGRDLIELLFECLDELKTSDGSLEIVSY